MADEFIASRLFRIFGRENRTESQRVRDRIGGQFQLILETFLQQETRFEDLGIMDGCNEPGAGF